MIKPSIFTENEFADFIKDNANDISKDYDVIFLNGPLGAGKTFFVRNLCNAFGCNSEVHSPSFGFYHVYNLPLLNKAIWHYDLYRMDEDRRNYQHLKNVDIEEALTDTNLVIIEWGSDDLYHYILSMGFKVKVIDINYCDDGCKRNVVIR